MPPPREDLDRILHDLRGPLNSMVMHVEVLKRALADDPDALASVTAIQGELSRLTRMLPAAFDVLALERGPPARRPPELRVAGRGGRSQADATGLSRVRSRGTASTPTGSSAANSA